MRNPFRRVRFSLTGLFAATLFVACVVATLRYTTRLWADAAFTLALAAVGVAALGAIYRSGATRAFWVGALLGGAGYLTLAYGPWIGENVRPHLLTSPLLSAAFEKMQAMFGRPMAFTFPSAPVPVPGPVATYRSPDAAPALPQSSSYYYIPNIVRPDVGTNGSYDPLVAPAASPPFAVPVYQSATAWLSDLPDWDHLERAGHSLTALFVAFVFGNIARWFYRTHADATAKSDGESRGPAPLG